MNKKCIFIKINKNYTLYCLDHDLMIILIVSEDLSIKVFHPTASGS